jgi:hypothetical protein
LTDRGLLLVCQPYTVKRGTKFARPKVLYSRFDTTRVPKMSTPNSNEAKPKCPHKRTQVIAKDNDAQYIECLDCGEILEVGELPTGESSGESLSDA